MQAMTLLHWNAQAGRYENEAIWVDGDAYAEARQSLMNTLRDEGIDEEVAFAQADAETANPDGWLNAARDAADDSAGLL